MSGGSRRRLAVIFGGASPEHTVSVRSARSVLAAVDRERFEPLPLAVDRSGGWVTAAESAALLAAFEAGAPECVPAAAGHALLRSADVLASLNEADVVFPLIHGRGGEDGALQGLLELAGLPYVGAGVGASGVGMDKTLMKALFAQAGLPLAPYRVLRERDWRRQRTVLEDALADLSLPLFVKPSNGGSSLGIVKLHARDEIGPAVEEALRYDRKVIVEQGIAGRELECGALERPAAVGGGVEAAPPGEIRCTREFYDYTAKYDDPGTELVLRPDLPPGAAEQAQLLATAAFAAIDCAGMARVDLFLDADDRIWLNEINTIPGFTRTSMFPRTWEAAGLSFPQLIDRLVALALEREAGRSRDS